MIAKAERHLRALGFTQCRVRHYGATAVVELPMSKMDDFLNPPVRAEAELGIKAAGYETVELNPNGFRSGSLNDALKRQIESTT